MNLFTTFPRILAAIFFCFFAVLSCSSEDSSSSGPSNSAPCESRTGNLMSAKVNSQTICTDLGSALLFDSELSIVGIFSTANPPSSITLVLTDPAVGTFDLDEAQYSTIDESEYFVVNDIEGSGSITIDTISDTQVEGTFEFTAIGINADTGAPNGNEAVVTSGTFKFALTN